VRPHAHPDAADLLRTEHAVVRVLASAAGETEAYPGLLAAIGESLSCAGALWLPSESDGELRCAETWPTGAAAGASLAPEAWSSGRPAAVKGAFAFPLRGIGVMAFATTAPLEPDADLLDTVESLGTQISQFVERCRAQQAVRASDARKSAILNAAFDCIITMDHEGAVVEINRAAERTFGYSAAEMVGHELAAVIIPPYLREAHRAGLARYLRTGVSAVGGHPLELMAMRADGSEFPVEVVITRADLPGPALFCGYLRDMTETRAREREERRLAEEQAALRRVATAVAAVTDPRRVFGVVTEEVARLLRAQSSNMVRFDDGMNATVVGGWSEGGVSNVPVGDSVRMDGDTASRRVHRTGAPARIDDYDAIEGDLAVHLRGLGFRCAVAAPIFLGGRLWGAVIVSSIDPEPFPAGSEQRIADFAELAAQALANASAREELAASRARIVAAGDAERRRLERNLHDGAQQRLVSLALMLRMAARRHPGDDDLVRAGDELTHALQELRELARGIHPAVLTERGLEPAVEALATRAPLPVELDVTLGDARLPGPVEAAAYYMVAEALTNVAKYAHASGVSVGVACADGHACIEVRDDGVGGAAAERGSGLRGLADRVEALGGRFVLTSPEGAGTTLRAEIPVPSRS
jgi:PAS domain S-box-containing protein